MIRNFATFGSNLPDDSIESEGEIVVPCGRGLMELIRSAFQLSRYEVTEIDQHSFYGWSFDATGAEGTFWLMIQYPEPWLLMIQDSRPIWRRAFAGKADFEQFINRSHAIMQSVSEISDLRWVTEREWQELSRRTNPNGEQVVPPNGP
jgi:hypothetical protein